MSLWAMFSADARRAAAGENRYAWHDPGRRVIVTDTLHEFYRKEGIEMAYTMDDLLNDWLQTLPLEKRLKGLSPEELLKGLSPEKRLKGLSPEELLKGLSSEELLEGLSPEEILRSCW